MLVTHPSLASLRLEPGGVVSDIVPKTGYERTLGVNVLKDVGQRAAANEALARRVLTVAGPIMLDQGGLSIVARQPVFQRTSDGRESFWGFVAASMRLQEVLNQARPDDLVRHGYEFAFFAPASGQQKALGIALRGLKSLRDSVQEPVRVQNLNLGVALKPRGGWVNKSEVALESVAVMLLSAFIALSAKLLASRGALETELRAATQRLSREAADRAQAQAEYRGAKEKLDTTQADLQQNQLALQKLESELTGSQAKLKGDILARDEAAHSKDAELQEAHASLRKAQETIGQLQAELEAAGQAQAATAAERERLERNQNRIAELQLRLEAAIRAGRQTAEASAASAARRAELEQSNRELIARLAAAERAEARVAELEALVEKARQELKQPEETSARTEEPSLPQGDSAVAPTAPASRKHESTSPPTPQTQSPAGTVAPAGPPVTREAQKAPQRKKARQDDQLSLFGNEASLVPAAKLPGSEVAEVQVGSHRTHPNLPVASSKEPEPRPSRHLPAPPPVDPAQLRKATNQMVPLLAERDPGAKDCLRDNRKTFRSAFSPEDYVKFEQLVKQGDADTALDQLKKAVRKHGISC